MKKRGKILRDTSSGQGLLSIDGTQYPFQLDGVWRSDTAPKIDMSVEVELTERGDLLSITAIPESQLAREQAERVALMAKQKSAVFAANAVTRFGLPTLIALGTLIVGWFFLSALNANVTSSFQKSITFWNLLSLINGAGSVVNGLNETGGSAGFYGFVAIVAIISPLLPYFIKEKKAHLLSILPLLFMLFVCYSIYSGINHGVDQARGMAGAIGGEEAEKMTREMSSEMLKAVLQAISIGLGTYVSFVASLFFALKGITKYLASKA